MNTNELRERYLSFFESKGCVRRPSDVLVPKGDPSVLFTPAGMNQFKNEFLGIGQLDFSRATTCQKCLRTGDIQNVGVTAYHHTFFEMLGNFSFGDYFKKEAIHWAWEFLTDKKWLALDPDRLTVTVYLDDDEAFDIWNKEINLPADRIRRDNEDENFWPAGAPTSGPDGVCGPCSEIFYHPPGSKKEVEIWNLVFTQFNRVGDPPDNLRPLPKQNIDTGMGLERTAAVLQGVESNFETDGLKPLCHAAAEAVGVKYEFSAPQGRALRRIADHVRAATFCIHEGVNPGKDKESYVVRQLLRRALLEGYLLQKHDPFLHQIVPTVVEMMQVPYPELKETAGNVVDVIRDEEKQFLGVVERGLHKLNDQFAKAKANGGSTISGDDAFDLHQTDGFLIELTQAMAAKNNLAVDMDKFHALVRAHQQTSGSNFFADSVMAEGPLDAIRKSAGGTEFVGYESIETTGQIVGIIAEKQLVDELTEVGHANPVAVVLDRTAFYGEAGGQVGDSGVLVGDGCEFAVEDTQRDGELLLHIGHLKAGTLKQGMTLTARVDETRRAGIRRAHSATHILHHALQSTLQQGAMQRGSKVENDALRFDYSYNKPLTPEQVTQIEDEINACISTGTPVDTQLMAIDDARKAGATALFGEKYPDKVRVVSMGEFSKELCGGTHLANTGQVGVCRIIKDELVASGVRRISALTGPRALQRIRETEAALHEIGMLLKTQLPEDLPRRVTALQDELREARRELARQSSESIAGSLDELIAGAAEAGGVKIITHAPENCTRDSLRDYADQIRAKVPSAAILLGAVIDGKVSLLAAVSKDLVKRGVSASDCVKTAAKVVGGGGGGRPDLAEAGGKIPEKLPEALQAGLEYFREKLSQ